MKRNRTVEKIIRQQEKDRELTKLRLEQKSQNIQKLQQEKNSNKWAIEKQKIIDEFEKMKKSGKLNYKTLTKMGVELPTKNEIKENLKVKGTRSGFNRSMSSGKGGGSQKALNSNSDKKSSTAYIKNDKNPIDKPEKSESHEDSKKNVEGEKHKSSNNNSKSKPDFKDNNTPKPGRSPAVKPKAAAPEKFKGSPYAQNTKGQKQSPNAGHTKPAPVVNNHISDKDSEKEAKTKQTPNNRKNSVTASVKSGGNTKRSQDSTGMKFVIS